MKSSMCRKQRARCGAPSNTLRRPSQSLRPASGELSRAQLRVKDPKRCGLVGLYHAQQTNEKHAMEVLSPSKNWMM